MGHKQCTNNLSGEKFLKHQKNMISYQVFFLNLNISIKLFISTQSSNNLEWVCKNPVNCTYKMLK